MSLFGRGGRQRNKAADAVGVLAVLLAVGGAVALGTGLNAQDPAPPQVPAAVDASAQDEGTDPADPGTTSAEKPARTAGKDRDVAKPADQRGAGDQARDGAQPAIQQLDYSRPVSLRIPKIGVTSELVDLGLDESGAMETPEPEELAGWFTPSPPPGIAGSTVIAGHVTWNQQPTVFFRLGELRVGDRVEVRREDGINTVFEVTRLGTFPKDSLPTKDIFDHPAQSELRLITCGGRYDDVNNRYLSNVIVWAKIVDVVGA